MRSCGIQIDVFFVSLYYKSARYVFSYLQQELDTGKIG